ncbi:MAG: nodulation protein NfeD [Muribaculaceae bacterium]|nr:nodulation protein NfeD [Muribaculaceae bacterium]
MRASHIITAVVAALMLTFANIGISAQERVFVIPVETEIDLGAFRHFRQACTEARQANADIVLVRLNTYGGALDAADSIRSALLKMTVPTVAFVDVNAASAGALIALACDSVYMAPGASMGSATVVNASGEPMPAKYQSYMSTIMRATAEHHGRVADGDTMRWRRDPAIAASMVNPEESVSLTGSQAVACGYADGIASDIGEIMNDLGIDRPEYVYYQSSLTDDILGFLSSAAVRAVLVMLILGGIYMEMHTPGLGFAAAVALVAATLYFLPMFVGGSMPAWVVICFVAGVVLIALEVFVIPGFGVCGVCGILAVMTSLVGAMVNNDSVTGVDFRAVTMAASVVLAGLIMAVAAVWYLTSSKGPRWVRRHSELMTELRTSDGFIGVDMNPTRYVGQIARTVTVLRPSGKIEIGNNVFDAVSVGVFIPAGRHVKILRYENAQLYVTEESAES